MRIFTVLTLTAAFCFCAMTGCSLAEDTADSESTSTVETAESGAGDAAQIPNPWSSYDSLDALNAAAGTALHTPGELAVTDESFSAITDGTPLAQYDFSYNGGQYTLRASATQEDISGVYQNGQTLTALAGDSTEVFTTADNALWLHWFDGDTQYSLYAVDASAEDFAAVAEAVR